MDEQTYRRMLPVFVLETRQRLDDMDHAILALAREPGDTRARSVLLTAAHTIKGNASAMGLKWMTLEAQRIELWATLPSGGLTRGMLAGLNDARTALRAQLAEVAEGMMAEVA